MENDSFKTQVSAVFDMNGQIHPRWCRFLGFAVFINNPGSDYIRSTHQEVGDLSDASGGGGQKLQGIFDKFNEQTGERPKGKCADECRKVR